MQKGSRAAARKLMGNYVIFDMDGTLFDTELLMIQCWERAAAKYGIEGVVAVCHECIGTNARETEEIFLRHYGAQFPICAIRDEVVEDFRNTLETVGPPVKPFVRETLHYLKDAGYHLAVASGTVTELVVKELTKVGHLTCFDCVVGGDMAAHGKPAPDIFLAACEQLGCAPKDAVVVEDSFFGIQAAHAAGSAALMVPDLIPPTEEIRALCRGVFADLSGVLDYFRAQDAAKAGA